jgi:hypothetical protein
MHTVINRSGWLVAGVLALFVVAAMTGVVSGGPLDPTGPPSSSSSGVRSPGTPITSVPFTISSSGYYYLTGNLTTAGGFAIGITVNANDVTIDMRGFTLASPDLTDYGIFAQPSSSGITVEHGRFNRFAYPLSLGGPGSFVTDVHVRDFSPTGTGITVSGGSGSLIDGCTVTATIPGTSGYGIELYGSSGVVRNCVVTGMNRQGVALYGGNSVLESSQVSASGLTAGTYGVLISCQAATCGLNATVRDNTLENGSRDIGVGQNFATIIDNAIHCAASIVNTGAFSYYAPTGSEAHANVPRFSPGFC